MIEITKGEIRPLEIKLERQTEVKAIPTINEELKASYEATISSGKKPSFLEMAWFVVTNSPSIISLIYQFIRILNMNEDKKTTIMATTKVICGILALALSVFKVELPGGVQEAVIGMAGLGYMVFSWLQGFWTNKKPAEEAKQ